MSAESSPLPFFWCLVGLFAAAVAAYDFWLMRRGGYQASISWHLYQTAQRYPIVAALFGLAIGVILGHLFWPQ